MLQAHFLDKSVIENNISNGYLFRSNKQLCQSIIKILFHNFVLVSCKHYDRTNKQNGIIMLICMQKL